MANGKVVEGKTRTSQGEREQEKKTTAYFYLASFIALLGTLAGLSGTILY